MKNQSRKILQRGDRALVGALLLVLVACVAREAVFSYQNYFNADADTRVTTPMADAKVRSVAPKPTPIEVAAEQLLAQRRCLAEAMYYEARGEGAVGEMAVAEVIFHRMRSSQYPNTICGVVFEGAQDKRACQFSFVCNGDMERPKNPHSWAVARLLAAKIMTGAVRLGDITENATSYHAVSVDPRWAATLQKTVQIGNHIFYRARTRSRGT
jgi:spore germination cell wall hydrolase CwlJ-like protein